MTRPDSVTGEHQPYYTMHQILDLTCPYCTGRLNFLTNEAVQSIYSCQCGRWFRKIDWELTNSKENWAYEPKEGYEAKI